jgi:hypothetical protein
MKSRTTKLVTAAGIIVAILISVSHFHETVVQAVEFEEITQAMQHVPWMHMTKSGFEGGANATGEEWIGFESRIHAGKEPDGTVHFSSEKDHRLFVYQPNTRVITISYLEAFPMDVTSPTTLVESMYKMLKNLGAKTVAKMGEYKGQRAQVQEFTLQTPSADDAETKELTLYINPDSKLLYGAKLSGADANGKVTMAGEITFNYPETGPQSIYDLGVPRDARIVDNTPAPDFLAVSAEYSRCKAQAAQEYLAVIVHQEDPASEVVRMLDVDYRSGRRERHECYFLSPGGEAIPELGRQSRALLDRNLEPLLAWARRHYDDPGARLSIQLYDGQYYNWIDRNGEGAWGRLNKAYSPQGDIEVSQTMASQAWPTIASTARIIPDDYAQQNGWICLENLTQGRVFPGGAVGHPGRFLYYLDPAQDYLCRRQVMERRPDAEWQEDKSWLKNADPKKMIGGGMTVFEITEVFQAPNGHWYPRVIVGKQTEASEDYRNAPMRLCDVETIYLDLSPTLPEGIFDPNRLPGQ